MNNGILSKEDLLLMMIYAGEGEKKEIKGITRLMKLIFLLNKAIDDSDFNFEPYKMGPYSRDVYATIEFFNSIPSADEPIIVVENSGGKKINSIEVAKYFKDIDSVSESINANASYVLSDIGIKVAKKVWNDADADLKDKVTKIRKNFGDLPLQKLLKYVYDEYPEMTIRSEIKDYVYGN